MYKFMLYKNHFIVEIDNYHFIVDTGSPVSYTFRNDLNVINIGGNVVTLRAPGYNWDIERIRYLVTYPVDGLLGMDAFKSGLTIYRNDYSSGLIDFRPDNNVIGTACPIIGMYQGFAPIINVNNDKLFIVDTGAMYAYGSENFVKDYAPDVIVEDYNPSLGKLESPLYHTTIEIKGKEYHIDTCYNEKVNFPIPNFLLVGNVTTLFERECCINYKDKVIIFY